LAKISPLPQTPGAAVPTPTPVFRTSKVSVPVTPAPQTPEPVVAKKPAKAPEVVLAAAEVAPTPTPAVTSKHGKKIAAAATPETSPKKSGKGAAVAVASTPPPTPGPTVKLADDSGADAATEAASSPPAPPSKHSKKIATASTPEPKPAKILQFQPVADASEPAASVKTAAVSSTDQPVVLTDPTPAPSSKRAKKRAATATATPDPAPKKPAKAEELTADSMALPPLDSTPKRSKSLDSTASVGVSSAPGPTFKKGGENVDLIPEPIAANATPSPARRTRRSSPTPAPGSALAVVHGTQVVVPQPILPAPTADAAPVRGAGSTFKVDRYEDLHAKDGF